MSKLEPGRYRPSLGARGRSGLWLLIVALLLLAGSATAQRTTSVPPRSRFETALHQSQALLHRGDTQRAIELLEPFLESHAREKRLVLTLAEAHLRSGEPLRAAARIEEALHQHRLRDLELWILLARAYREAGDGSQATASLLGALRERPAWALRLRDQFELLVTDSLIGGAALESFSAQALGSDAPDAWREILAHLYVVTDRDAAALDLVTELDRRQSADGKRLMVLARDLAQRGAPAVALAAFDAVLTAGASADLASECNYERGRLLERLERFADAAEAFAQAAGRRPERPLALRASLRRAQLLRTELAARALAESLYTDLLAKTDGLARARQIRPLREEAQLGLAECALAAGEFTRAAEQFAALEQSAVSGGLRERAAFERAEMLFYAGDFAAAELAYYDLTDHYPKGEWVNDALARVLLLGEHAVAGEALTRLARCEYLARAGDADSARILCRQELAAQSETPLRPALRLLLVRLQLAVGAWAAADSSADRLLADDPQSRETPVALLELALALEAQADARPRARERYEELVLRYPDSWEARRARARLEVLRTGEEPS